MRITAGVGGCRAISVSVVIRTVWTCYLKTKPTIDGHILNLNHILSLIKTESKVEVTTEFLSDWMRIFYDTI